MYLTPADRGTLLSWTLLTRGNDFRIFGYDGVGINNWLRSTAIDKIDIDDDCILATTKSGSRYRLPIARYFVKEDEVEANLGCTNPKLSSQEAMRVLLKYSDGEKNDPFKEYGVS